MEEIEDTEVVVSEHDRLISAISKLDKTQHITEPTRNEATHYISEFNLIKYRKKLNLNNVVKILENTSHHVKIGKKLKKSTDISRVLLKPLEKPQAERIKRVTGYGETKRIVGRWNPVVARNRTVDYVSFPIKHMENSIQSTGEFLRRFELKSELEKELEKIEPPPPVEEEDEEEQTYPMSFEEMLEHRQHIAKLRAQQSYKAAKAKRQSKIKSKKYHRILKKEKLKEQLKEFEELQKTNPEEALKKLEALEKSRALERHTLRHKNTGKWAKSKMIRAKYDKEVRQELAEQLAVSRELTQKTQNTDSADDESDNNEHIPDMSLAQDPMNPWVTKKSNIDAEFEFGYKRYIKGKMFKREESDSESDGDETTNASNNTIINRKLNTLQDNIDIEKHNNDMTNINNENKHTKQEPVEKPTKTKITNNKIEETITSTNKTSKLNRKNITATSNWVVESVNIAYENRVKTKDISTTFDNFESKISKKVEQKLKKLRKNIEKFENNSSPKVNEKEHEEKDSLKYLQFKNKLKPVIDEQLIERGTKDVEEPQNDKNPLSVIMTANKLSKDPIETTSIGNLDIDFTKFSEFKPKYLNTALPENPAGLDDLDDDEQVVPKLNIEEVFEEEDVVASFRQEKEDEINKNKPQVIDLTLPGWGSWGGKGVKAPKRKRNRFILKAPEVTPRRDENKGDIIITEYKDPKLASHKLSDVPFPFRSVKEYEASIRAPIGNTFIPEKAYKKLIKPNVITKAGTIIEPMDEDELLVKRNRNYKNTNVIKLLSKK